MHGREVHEARAWLERRGHVDPVVAVATADGTEVAGDADARFEIGSVTKVFTALLLAQMAAQGLVRLDDPIGVHLPAGLPLAPKADQISLEDLACHRSGLPRLPPGLWRAGLGAKALRDPYAGIDTPRLHAALAEVRVRSTPGRARIRYSNLGVGLLGHLLGAADGRGYETAVLTRVVRPLRLEHTSFEDEPLHQGRYRGRPVTPWHLAELAGAGGLHSSARDLISFARAQAAPPVDLAAAIAETHQPRGSGRLKVGLGWFLIGDGVLTHSGGTLGARSEVIVDPLDRTAVVVLADSRRGTAAAAHSVFRAATGRAAGGPRRPKRSATTAGSPRGRQDRQGAPPTAT